jgi:hypothetical protein
VASRSWASGLWGKGVGESRGLRQSGGVSASAVAVAVAVAPGRPAASGKEWARSELASDSWQVAVVGRRVAGRSDKAARRQGGKAARWRSAEAEQGVSEALRHVPDMSQLREAMPLRV